MKKLEGYVQLFFDTMARLDNRKLKIGILLTHVTRIVSLAACIVTGDAFLSLLAET